MNKKDLLGGLGIWILLSVFSFIFIISGFLVRVTFFGKEYILPLGPAFLGKLCEKISLYISKSSTFYYKFLPYPIALILNIFFIFLAVYCVYKLFKSTKSINKEQDKVINYE